MKQRFSRIGEGCRFPPPLSFSAGAGWPMHIFVLLVAAQTEITTSTAKKPKKHLVLFGRFACEVKKKKKKPNVLNVRVLTVQGSFVVDRIVGQSCASVNI